MNITWNSCVQMMTGRRPIPLGMTLEYEFSPSTRPYIEGYSVHPEYYTLSKEDYMKARDEKLHRYCTTWNCARANNPANFSWQQFKLTGANKNVMILRMDRNGHVCCYAPKTVQVPVEVLVKIAQPTHDYVISTHWAKAS